MKVEEISRPITAFTVPNRGRYQFKRIPFGLVNAPATWQYQVDSVLRPDLEPFVFVYLDGTVVVSQGFDERLNFLKKVFRRLNSTNFKVSRDKCNFCRLQLKYLGYVVNKNGFSVDTDSFSILNKAILKKC